MSVLLMFAAVTRKPGTCWPKLQGHRLIIRVLTGLSHILAHFTPTPAPRCPPVWATVTNQPFSLQQTPRHSFLCWLPAPSQHLRKPHSRFDLI
jgi:hypothetical protein